MIQKFILLKEKELSPWAKALIMKHALHIATLLSTKNVYYYIGWFVAQLGFEGH